MPTVNWNVVLAFIFYMLATGILNLMVAERSRIDSWTEQHPTLAGLMKIMRAAGFDPWGIVAAAVLITKGRLPLAQRTGKTLAPPPFAKDILPIPIVTIPPPPPTGNTLPPLLILCFALSTLKLLPGCSSTPSPCSPNNPVMIAKAAECHQRVQLECKDIPDNQCPAVTECDQWGEARCK